MLLDSWLTSGLKKKRCCSTIDISSGNQHVDQLLLNRLINTGSTVDQLLNLQRKVTFSSTVDQLSFPNSSFRTIVKQQVHSVESRKVEQQLINIALSSLRTTKQRSWSTVDQQLNNYCCGNHFGAKMGWWGENNMLLNCWSTFLGFSGTNTSGIDRGFH